jgi:hypothetical protein
MTNVQTAWRTKVQVELIDTGTACDIRSNPLNLVNGGLWVELLWYHGLDAPASVRFPQWQEVSLMAKIPWVTQAELDAQKA